jgi:hypothetical protein
VTVSKFQEIARQVPPGSEEDEDQFEDAQSDIPKRGWMDWVRGAPEGEFPGDESGPELGGGKLGFQGSSREADKEGKVFKSVRSSLS